MKKWMLAALAAALSCSAFAQSDAGKKNGEANWPTRPVRMLVGSAPGGGTDAMARAVADRLGPLLGQPVIVENRPGVSNTLAVDFTVKSTDGHTMVMGVSTAHAIAPHLIKLGYDNDRDLVAVAFAGAVPNVLVVGGSQNIHSVAQLVQLARSKPGSVNFASSGSGSTQHIAAEVLRDAAQIDIVHVPYRGSAPALIDVMGGQVQFSFDTMPSVIGHIRSGKMRALAVTTPQRSPLLPDVPTMAEAGYPHAWYGVYMPATTPVTVQNRVHDAVQQVLAMPETKQRLAAIGAETRPMTQPQFADFQRNESQRYAALIQKNQIKPD
ncbi:MAG: hypothetical protein GAK30_02463 [Paracidovorax wautersii]|uniref:Tripartite-type tricarboxylate transporter, receptor component TctC n=1 Tax=Paracidovorax wautersii TaxID=1177982 RepID=A0A7V8FN32_9BURK|nr:MAG: hypothetical protein GAK30_02463 [Paracidovorax wautersii]